MTEQDQQMTVFQPPSLYQESFRVDFIGRRKPASKRQVTWTFVHGAAIHSVMFTWSIQSGKISILLDGAEIDSCVNAKGFSIVHRKHEVNVFRLEVLACRVAPNHNADVEFLCYELIVNGQCFSQLPMSTSENANRLTIVTPNTDHGRPLLMQDETDSSSDGRHDEDQDDDVDNDDSSASDSYENERHLESVVDIVYPNGVPAYQRG